MPNSSAVTANNAAIEKCDKKEIELTMHSIQDSFTHSGKDFSNGHRVNGNIWKVGTGPSKKYKKVLDGKYYISPDLDNKAWEAAKKATEDQLKKWHAKVGK